MFTTAISALDLFRFSSLTDERSFSNQTRFLAPGLVDDSNPVFWDGRALGLAVPFDSGKSSEPDHWAAGSLGLMGPDLASGTANNAQANDLRAMSAVGWNVPEIELLPLPSKESDSSASNPTPAPDVCINLRIQNQPWHDAGRHALTFFFLILKKTHKDLIIFIS